MPGYNWTAKDLVTADRLNDPNIRIAYGDLAAGSQHAKIFSWQNTVVSGSILVHLVLINVTTPATAAAQINVGSAGTEIESDNLIDGCLINATGVKNTIKNIGTNGLGAVLVADDEWITGFEDDTAASTDLVGKYYIFYTKV
jgi:hypothetical protein